MRKLIFSFFKTSARPGYSKSIEISTHYGTSVKVSTERPLVLSVREDDSMSDAELLEWYKLRYAGFGLGVKIGHSGPVVTPPVEQPVINAVSAEESKEDLLEEAETPEVTESVETEEVATVEEAEKPSIDVDSMSYFEMVQFAKDNNIEVGGRGKELYIAALKEWAKANS